MYRSLRHGIRRLQVRAIRFWRRDAQERHAAEAAERQNVSVGPTFGQQIIRTARNGNGSGSDASRDAKAP